MLRQSLQQRLNQRLSPQQIQLMKLLQVPTAQLQLRIKEELEANPTLEEIDSNDSLSEDSNNEEETQDVDEMNEQEEDVFLENAQKEDWNEEQANNDYEYDDEGEIADYKTREEFNNNEDKIQPQISSSSNSFLEFVTNQIEYLDFSEQEYFIAEQILGSLDDDGYLRRERISIKDDLLIKFNIIMFVHYAQISSDSLLFI